MSQFDKITERLAKQFAAEYFCYPEAEENLEDKLKLIKEAYLRANDSLQASIEAVIAGLEKMEEVIHSAASGDCRMDDCWLILRKINRELKAEIQANGDWPLEEK